MTSSTHQRSLTKYERFHNRWRQFNERYGLVQVSPRRWAVCEFEAYMEDPTPRPPRPPVFYTLTDRPMPLHTAHARLEALRKQEASPDIPPVDAMTPPARPSPSAVLAQMAETLEATVHDITTYGVPVGGGDFFTAMLTTIADSMRHLAVPKDADKRAMADTGFRGFPPETAEGVVFQYLAAHPEQEAHVRVVFWQALEDPAVVDWTELHTLCQCQTCQDRRGAPNLRYYAGRFVAGAYDPVTVLREIRAMLDGLDAVTRRVLRMREWQEDWQTHYTVCDLLQIVADDLARETARQAV